MTFFFSGKPRKHLLPASLLASLLTVATLPAFAADDLAKVLAKLDESSVKFHSAQADMSSDIVQVNPIPDTDTQTGTILFERKNGQLQMALHLKTDNGKPVPKDVVYADGLLKFYEPLQKQMQIFKSGSNKTQADTLLTVGFGGSGKDLEKNWEIIYSGSEQIDGKAAAKLQLTPRDAGVKNTIPKMILWVDVENGLALRQQSFDPSGNYRTVSYRNIRLNASVPANAFEVKTAPGTQIVNH